VPFENGEFWHPEAPDQRGRHKTLVSAVDAALKDLLAEKSAFYDSLCDNWKRLFPDLPARPGRYSEGTVFVYVKNAPTSFVVRPRLRAIKARLAQLPGAPKNLDLKLEIHVR